MATSKVLMRRTGLVLACTLALAQPAWAQLFGNSAELTRQIQALQQRMDAVDARLGKLESAMQKNEQLLGLLKEVETLKAELARMRGQDEVQGHKLETLGKRQNDLYADLDQRIADLAKAAKPAAGVEEAQSAASASAPPAAGAASEPTAESRSYEAALAQFREANYPAAIAGFKGFLKDHPKSELAANAQYWIGYSHYALKDYKTALAHQQKLVAAYPASPKVPDALLNIASNQLALDNLAGARKTLEEIVAKHPDTHAATLAARRLAALK
ncbi:MAG: tol-pal system protein YbgF [Thiobacillus sp. GWE1_62_9]|nr:MAG: tol-pal system protein YbgF [Thiobacillus sp. GWE1_62_9]HBU30702.1 tol-pal system protein YbgF [Thiobacillus sp.]